MNSTMVASIILFGTLTFLTGFAVLLSPDRICGFLRKRQDRMILYVLNVVVRLVFGISLLLLSSYSRMSTLTDLIGWFCITIALILACLGRKRFIRSISWAVTLVENNNHIAGLLIMVFGAFLVYAFST